MVTWFINLHLKMPSASHNEPMATYTGEQLNSKCKKACIGQAFRIRMVACWFQKLR